MLFHTHIDSTYVVFGERVRLVPLSCASFLTWSNCSVDTRWRCPLWCTRSMDSLNVGPLICTILVRTSPCGCCSGLPCLVGIGENNPPRPERMQLVAGSIDWEGGKQRRLQCALLYGAAAPTHTKVRIATAGRARADLRSSVKWVI